MSIFSYGFMQKAFLIAIVISIITPLIGNVVVLKRFSTVGDALSHSSLAGVAIGLLLNKNPLISAVIVTVLAAMVIELLRRSFLRYSEVAIAVTMSFSVGLAAILSGFVKDPRDFNSFLYGSIVNVDMTEVVVVYTLGVMVIVVSVVYYRELFYLTFDEESAVLAGINSTAVNFIFIVLTAVVVSVASRTVGALIISSLLVLPTACGMQIANSFRQNTLFSLLFGIFFMLSGLWISFYTGLKTGGTIVLIGVGVLVLILILKKVLKYRA